MERAADSWVRKYVIIVGVAVVRYRRSFLAVKFFKLIHLPQ